MRPGHLITGFFLCLICFVFTLNLQAKTTRIAIVSVADTTFIHRHIGFTAFTNYIDTLPINFSMINYMESKLLSSLNPGFSVSVVQLPDSVLRAKNRIFISAKTKKVKEWINSNKDLYDFVIVIDNAGLSENNQLIPKNTSGIFSNHSYASYYSTISFFAYHTSSLKLIEYYNLGGEFIMPIRNFRLPKERNNFTPEILNFLYDGFKNYLDSRVEYFLAKSNLLLQDK
jgi:hypothetical protein